jgi:hypothetical protein
MLSIVYHNPKDKEYYTPILKAISERLLEVERKYSRGTCLQFLTLDQILELTAKNEIVIPVANTEHGIRCFIDNTSGISRALLYTWNIKDDKKIGKLLGYPDCCIDHFIENWGSGKSDPTRFMGNFNSCGGYTPPYANIYYRWLGVRPVFHLPCSLSCEATIKMGEEIVPLYGELSEELLHILSLPVKYSNVNGIVEVSNPIFKFYTNDTDIVEVDNKNVVETDTWTANGFSSKEAQDIAHNFVIENLKKLDFKSIFDLGCGNGLLLSKICDAISLDIVPTGMDIKDKLVRNINFIEADIQKADFNYYIPRDVVMTSIERLYEAPNYNEMFYKLLNASGRYLVLTSYNSKMPAEMKHSVMILQTRDQTGNNTITVYTRPLYEDK